MQQSSWGKILNLTDDTTRGQYEVQIGQKDPPGIRYEITSPNVADLAKQLQERGVDVEFEFMEVRDKGRVIRELHELVR